MLILRRCKVIDIETATNIQNLVAEYEKEGSIPGMPSVNPQWEQYKGLESAGALQVIGAFIEEVLVGFVFILAAKLPHYGATIAVSESLFVGKEYRNTGAGLRLIKEAEKYAKEIGSPGLLISATEWSGLPTILEKFNYTNTNKVYFKTV